MPRNIERFDHTAIEWIKATIASEPGLSRNQLALRVCKQLEWRSPSGRYPVASCATTLRRLEHSGLITLPPPHKTALLTGPRNGKRPVPFSRPELCCTLDALGSIMFSLVNGDRNLLQLWRSIMDGHHPQGSGPLCGAQIRYIIESDRGILGAIGFSSAAYRLRERDQWIGWDEEARDRHLNQVINNSRFLILPQVRVKNLASSILSRAARTVALDWERLYGCRPVLMETFVDPQRYGGVCYRAANWIRIGQTSGRGRRDNNTQPWPKDIYVLPLVSDWRTSLEGREPAAPEDWVEEELGSVDLGDKRLNSRLLRLCRDFYRNPQALLPQACGSEAATKGAYRFFQNQRVSMESILQGHYQTTSERVRSHKGVILAVQDTTSLNYNTLRTAEGLGPIDARKTQGLLVHDTMAYTSKGVPLGLLDVQVWARDKKKDEGVCESIKWLHSFAAARRLYQACPRKTIVSVGDREADFYDLFLEAQKEDSPELLVRARHCRRLAGSDVNIWTHLARCPVAGILEVNVPARPGRPARVARLDVRFDRVTLKAPVNHSSRAEVTLWAVQAREQEKPTRGKQLEWLLLTTVAVNSFDDACERLNWYGVRWGIEIYHRTLKSGCRIEDRLLREAEEIKSCLALDMIVAWRVYFLTKQGRETPDFPCTVLLEDTEWKALTAYISRTSTAADRPPSLGEAMVMIARLGGYLPRSSGRPPGTTTTWRGMVALGWISGAWKAFGQGHGPPADPE